MRLLHISDTHGQFKPLRGSFDIIVHSGDLPPDPPKSMGQNKLGPWQLDWVKNNIAEFKEWLQGKPFLFCGGNHCFYNPYRFEELLNEAGIKAICLHNKITSFEGVKFFGFPFVPPINGSFAYETDNETMIKHCDYMSKLMNETYVDVIVAHCPPYNCLDANPLDGHHFGNRTMCDLLDYKLTKKMRPKWYLCGHIHSANSITVRNGLMVSNAARTQHIIQL
jgi:Icc-related predicted phosphoesterase